MVLQHVPGGRLLRLPSCIAGKDRGSQQGEPMKLSADSGLTMAVYVPGPGSPSHGALNLLASWTATPEQAEAATR